tara:strand:+ start:199 stop:588 length:390 start_codon:yes stop_codon:yes gene_type:complete
MIDLVPNVLNPIIALALIMPYITRNTFAQYIIPISLYCLIHGVYVSQIGLYITLLVATWCANNMNTFKAFVLSIITFHIVNLYAMFLHPDSTYIGALLADINLATGTALYLVLFALLRRGWQIASRRVY